MQKKKFATISQIPKSQAKLLPNKTHPIPGDEDNYVYCGSQPCKLLVLTVISTDRGTRRLPQPPLFDYYSDVMEIDHLDHCIDWIRQALMCAGDTSVIVWQWDPAQNKTTFQGDVAHTCRNFEKLREWGKSHAIQSHYDTSVRIEDGIVIPNIPKDFALG
ncbi:hypothetical protein GGX14DRAFT_399612 [Mycena pura]|uniref:Uncharacterized protein n=1 Tax=Mycena pura TaxID=153505 RepID=A0AAD6V4H8_9AGAR|nr:hypothetical protein GGX14DRAFT_399612 [Mycena pura]